MSTFLTRCLILTLAVSIVLASASVAAAAPTGKKYSTPEKALDAFVAAMRTYKLETLLSIFGKDAEPLFNSGDPVADEQVRREFLARYDEKHELVPFGETKRILLVGTDPWPLPMPIVKAGSRWAFDTAFGMEEILNRRIGRNELSAIQTCLAVADAQREYYLQDRDGDGILEYAQSLRSTVGLRNGLFWPADEGQPPSPLGQLVATAAHEGYSGASTSYYGYNYKLLRSQGSSAPGGAYDYMAGDNQIGGFAVLAFPTAYGDSGIMTIAVSHSGVVYQRDFGEATAEEVQKINTFDPGEGWTKVRDEDLQPIPEH